jgi:hypothetical protein
MAFRRPANLVPVTFTYIGAMDALTAVPLGTMRFDCEVYYIDVVMHDANVTFDETLITLLDDAVAIDAITVAAQAGTSITTSVDADDLSEGTIAADSAITMTVANVSTGADLGVTIIMWVTPFV